MTRPNIFHARSSEELTRVSMESRRSRVFAQRDTARVCDLHEAAALRHVGGELLRERPRCRRERSGRLLKILGGALEFAASRLQLIDGAGRVDRLACLNRVLVAVDATDEPLALDCVCGGRLSDLRGGLDAMLDGLVRDGLRRYNGRGQRREQTALQTRRMNNGNAALDEKVGGSGQNGNGREGNRKTSRDSEGKMAAQPIENAPRRASQARPEICRPRPHANGTRPRKAPFLHRARAATVLSSWNCGVDRASRVMFYAGDRLVLQIPGKSTLFQGLIPKESPRVPSSGSSVSSSSMSRPSL